MAIVQDGPERAVSPEMQSLAEYLLSLRTARRFSLREVEETADVSNAYLSQLENGKIRKPSPMILQKLAGLYGVSIEALMVKAGYLAQASEGHSAGRAVVAAGSPGTVFGELSAQEEEAMLKYLAFLRYGKSKS